MCNCIIGTGTFVLCALCSLSTRLLHFFKPSSGEFSGLCLQAAKPDAERPVAASFCPSGSSTAAPLFLSASLALCVHCGCLLFQLLARSQTDSAREKLDDVLRVGLRLR